MASHTTIVCALVSVDFQPLDPYADHHVEYHVFLYSTAQERYLHFQLGINLGVEWVMCLTCTATKLHPAPPIFCELASLYLHPQVIKPWGWVYFHSDAKQSIS